MSKTRRIYSIGLLLMAPLLLAGHVGQVRATAAQEVARLQRPDAARYASGLYDNSERWSYVSKKIATGEQDWLQVARLLIPNADGAFAEELRSDLALALLKHPANVLELIRESAASTSEMCSAPFSSPGKHWLRGYRMRAITAVRRVREPKMTKLRDDCIRELRRIDLSRAAAAYE